MTYKQALEREFKIKKYYYHKAKSKTLRVFKDQEEVEDMLNFVVNRYDTLIKDRDELLKDDNDVRYKCGKLVLAIQIISEKEVDLKKLKQSRIVDEYNWGIHDDSPRLSLTEFNLLKECVPNE